MDIEQAVPAITTLAGLARYGQDVKARAQAVTEVLRGKFPAPRALWWANSGDRGLWQFVIDSRCEFDPADLRAWLRLNWLWVRQPQQYGRGMVDLFRYTGYVSSHGQPLPTRPLRLFRGGPRPEHWHGMRWTEDFVTAFLFAAPGGYIWEAYVPPSGVLGQLVGAAFGGLMLARQSEVIVDPDCLNERRLVASRQS